MKKLILVLLMLPALSLAEDDIAAQIDQACERHSASLVARIKMDVIDNVSQTESQQMMALSMETCTAYFRRVFNQQAVAQTYESNDNESEDKKSWAEKIFASDGDDDRNKGHERLQRR
ncbi:MAG: hypothetical protein AAF410_02780 [Pseudomonadota bacterium]